MSENDTSDPTGAFSRVWVRTPDHDHDHIVMLGDDGKDHRINMVLERHSARKAAEAILAALDEPLAQIV